MESKIVIAVDGFSSCGKSTLAKQLAHKLKYTFIDSGAMYRAITLYFLRNHVDWQNAEEIISALKNIELAFEFRQNKELSEITLNGENVEYLIRDLIVAENVSAVSALPEVRKFAVSQQKALGRQKGIVMDGRDIGTTVFPKAELKIFMTADIAVRVKRRYEEMRQKNPNTTLDEVKENLQMRDYIDSTREVSPLRKAKDAIIIDNTTLTRDEQLGLALQYAQTAIQRTMSA